MWWWGWWTKRQYFIVSYITKWWFKSKIEYRYIIRRRNAFSRKCKLISRRIIITFISTFVITRRRTLRNCWINVIICDVIININAIISSYVIININEIISCYVIISINVIISFNVIISIYAIIITTYGWINYNVRIWNAYWFNINVIDTIFNWKLASRVLSISYYSHYNRGPSRNRCYPN
jgi:hypothetical protein